jgi:hypothetical protein
MSEAYSERIQNVFRAYSERIQSVSGSFIDKNGFSDSCFELFYVFI